MYSTGQATVATRPTPSSGSQAVPDSNPDLFKHEIGAVVIHSMNRLVVVCDMHGADLRDVLYAPGYERSEHSPRTVMREAILCDFLRLKRVVSKNIGLAWDYYGHQTYKAGLDDLRDDVNRLLSDKCDSLVTLCNMRKKDIFRILTRVDLKMLGITEYKAEIDTRAVMRRALLGMNYTNYQIQKKLDTVWP